jgi:CheY-like chemotaxis protein
MPDVDGLSFMRRMRASEGHTRVPAIALTAYATADDATRARMAGYQEHLSKPVEPTTLLRIAARWCTKTLVATATAS